MRPVVLDQNEQFHVAHLMPRSQIDKVSLINRTAWKIFYKIIEYFEQKSLKVKMSLLEEETKKGSGGASVGLFLSVCVPAVGPGV